MRKFGGIVIAILVCLVAVPAQATNKSVVDPQGDAKPGADFTNVTFTNSGDVVGAEFTVPSMQGVGYHGFSVNVSDWGFNGEYEDYNFLSVSVARDPFTEKLKGAMTFFGRG